MNKTMAEYKNLTLGLTHSVCQSFFIRKLFFFFFALPCCEVASRTKSSSPSRKIMWLWRLTGTFFLLWEKRSLFIIKHVTTNKATLQKRFFTKKNCDVVHEEAVWRRLIPEPCPHGILGKASFVIGAREPRAHSWKSSSSVSRRFLVSLVMVRGTAPRCDVTTLCDLASGCQSAILLPQASSKAATLRRTKKYGRFWQTDSIRSVLIGRSVPFMCSWHVLEVFWPLNSGPISISYQKTHQNSYKTSGPTLNRTTAKWAANDFK